MEPDSIVSPEILTHLVRRIEGLPNKGRRRLVGIAGAPASGKSTLAAALAKSLVRNGVAAVNVPMDGFHLDNCILDAGGLRDRKGAPETFDVTGFLAMVHRIRDEEELYFPVFDRVQDQSIAGAGLLAAASEIAIVEGNYLLYDKEPWNRLVGLWDLSIFVETPESVVLERCVKRWLDHGHTAAAARARAEGNDLANARLVAEYRLSADVTIADTPLVGG